MAERRAFVEALGVYLSDVANRPMPGAQALQRDSGQRRAPQGTQVGTGERQTTVCCEMCGDYLEEGGICKHCQFYNTKRKGRKETK